MLKKILAFLLLAAPAIGYSFEITNWYLRGFSGYNFLSIPSSELAEIKADPGYAVGGAIGYRFSESFRLEMEGSYRNNTLGTITLFGENENIELDLTGRVTSLAFMGNAFIDMPFNPYFIPYIGVGIGHYRSWGTCGLSVLEGTPDEINFKFKGDTFAYQAIAGLNILRWTKLDCSFEYHFLDAVADIDIERNHSITLSCRTTF